MKFKQKTKWCVITGAPSSGKTSVINLLAHKGYAIQAEVAREVIEKYLQEGKSREEVHVHSEQLQRDILDLKVSRERGLKPDTRIFLDRGIADSWAYFKLAGLCTDEVEDASGLFEYDKVFLFDQLPFVKDSVRVEDAEIAKQLDRLLEEGYKALGYTPIRVPVLSIEARAEFVLSHLER